MGIVGTDTSHVVAFTNFMNSGQVSGANIVVAYKGGSPEIEESRSRIEKYSAELRDKFGVKFVDKIAAHMRERIGAGGNAWDEVRQGAQAFLDVALDGDVQRIALLDGPAVLGRAAGGDVARLGLDLIHRGLLRSMERGHIDPQPLEPLARVLRAAITEAAMYIARSDDHASARADAGRTIDRLIGGLRREG